MKRTLILSMLSSTLLLSGCAAVGIATGVGAVAGMTAAKEGGLKAGVNDAVIKTQINDLWFRKNVDMFRKLDLTINQGRVLITGVVQNPEDRVEAVRLAWQPKGVKQVINEIRVGDSSSVQGVAKDEWIKTQLRARLIGNKDVQSINYSIEVVQGCTFHFLFQQGIDIIFFLTRFISADDNDDLPFRRSLLFQAHKVLTDFP